MIIFILVHILTKIQLILAPLPPQYIPLYNIAFR